MPKVNLKIFQAKYNLTFDVYNFRQMKQLEDKSIG